MVMEVSEEEDDVEGLIQQLRNTSPWTMTQKTTRLPNADIDIYLLQRRCDVGYETCDVHSLVTRDRCGGWTEEAVIDPPKIAQAGHAGCVMGKGALKES